MNLHNSQIGITCKQFTYTDEELKAASVEDLQRTLKCIAEVLPQLIGNMWPNVLTTSSTTITDELIRRAVNLNLPGNHYLLESGVIS